MKPTLEETIEVVSRMKECLQDVHGIYARMPVLVQKEHEAIKASNLDEVEKIAAEKTTLGSEFENQFKHLRFYSERLAAIYEALCGSADLRDDSISDCIKMFKGISAKFKERGFGAQVFDHVLAGFRDVFNKFLELKEEVRPTLEKNKYVLTKLLHQRQENYRFWQEVLMESMASYNRDGKQKAKHAGSVVAVKA